MIGYVYKLTCIETGNFYIGSTTKKIKYRLTDHKRSSKKCPNRKVYKMIKINNCTINLLETVDINDRRDLCLYENKYIIKCINDIKCANNNKSYIDDYENYHKEYQKDYQKDYQKKIKLNLMNIKNYIINLIKLNLKKKIMKK